MKRLISFILAISMLLSLAACGNSDVDNTQTTSAAAVETTAAETAAPTTEEPTTAEPTTEEPTTEELTTPAVSDIKTGTVVDGVYSNLFLGISCALDDSWIVATPEEMAQISGLTADLITDEELSQALESSGVVYDLYAAANDGLLTLNITLENLGLLYGIILSEQDYIDMSIDQLAPALESMGFADVTCEAITINFAGQEHAGIKVHGTYEGIDFYETLVCVKSGNYMAAITAASYVEDVTESVLELFTTYEGEVY